MGMPEFTFGKIKIDWSDNPANRGIVQELDKYAPHHALHACTRILQCNVRNINKQLMNGLLFFSHLRDHRKRRYRHRTWEYRRFFSMPSFQGCQSPFCDSIP